MFQARQGDVLIQQIDGLPPDARRVAINGDRIILVRGEATGHHHSVAAEHAVFYMSPQQQEADAGLLVLDCPNELLHQEHGGIAIPAGIYRVTRQREYSPEAIRNVAD